MTLILDRHKSEDFAGASGFSEHLFDYLSGYLIWFVTSKHATAILHCPTRHSSRSCSNVALPQFQACGTFKPFWYTSSDSGKSGQTGRLDNNCTFATHAAHRLTLRAFTGNQIGAWQRCTHCTRFTSPNVAWLPPILVRSQWVQEGLCEIVAAVLRRIWGLNSLWLEHWLLAWASLRLELASHSLRLECLSLLVDQLLPHQCSSNLALSQNVTKR